MPKHTRHLSNSHQRNYQVPMPLASPAMYDNQQRMGIPSDYYAVPTPGSATGISLQQQAHQHNPYESYDNGPAPAVSMPPAHHRASSGAWSPQEDQQLLAARMQGLNWGQIKETYFPGKSPNACRKRHERLMERKGADDWDNRKLQHLAKEYMTMRKEIWQGLATRTGEKWNVVEQKCMSNGLKNLQSAARAGSRRDRLEVGASMQGYDDDSGISGIGLTPVDELDASYSSPETTSSGAHSASSNTASASFQHLQHHANAHLQPLALGHGAYALGPYGGGYGDHHAYSSSVGSGANGSHGYSTHSSHANGQTSPFLEGPQRPPSVDMGIGAIMNRPRGGGV